MSGDIAISVQALTKTYRLYDSHFERVKETFHPLRRKYHRTFSALTNVSFDVKKGTTVGIIGRNGSGKSTLLQIICGILRPTAGTVVVKGRVSALLELGAGFNPEFTGRQNVYINGTILGLPNEEIRRRFDEIVGFADIGEFIDQPVKTYSSGMVIRLAFAVAISIEPDILVVDEALAVGDEAFQRKCFSRIQAIQEGGGTILFVSHSGATIVELCKTAVLLDRGELLLTGEPKEVVSVYKKLIYAPFHRMDALRDEIRRGSIGTDSQRADGSIAVAPTIDTGAVAKLNPAFDPEMVPKSTIRYESRGALIESPKIRAPSGEEVNILCRGERYIYGYTVRFLRAGSHVRFGMLIKTVSGVELGGAVSSPWGDAIPHIAAGEVVDVDFSFSCLLTPGVYFLNAGVTGVMDETEGHLDRIIDAVMFRVQPEAGIRATAIVDFCIIPAIRIRESTTAENQV